MIIFYHKETGVIVGFFEGRIHSESQLNMWLGEKDQFDRLVVTWKPLQWYNAKGEKVEEGSSESYTADYIPDHAQTELFISFDNHTKNPHDYRVTPEGILLPI